MSTEWKPADQVENRTQSSDEIIQELKENRNNLRIKILEYQHMLHDNVELSKEERGKIKQKISSYNGAYHSIRDQLSVAGVVRYDTGVSLRTFRPKAQIGARMRATSISIFSDGSTMHAEASSNIFGETMGTSVAKKDFTSSRFSPEVQLFRDPTERKEDPNKFTHWAQLLYKFITERQATYIHYYYNLNYTMEQIGELGGVNKSTVSRTITRGLNRMKRYVEDLTLASKCDISPTMFDIVKFIYENKTMTERQKIYLLVRMSYARPSIEKIGDVFGVNKSTISRTISRAMRIIVFLEVEDRIPAYRPTITWDSTTTLESVREELGL